MYGRRTLLLALGMLALAALPAKADSSEEGKLRVVVFLGQEGAAHENVPVGWGDRALGVTNRDGVLATRVPAGVAPLRVVLEGVTLEASPEVIVRAGLTTEVVVTLDARGRAVFETHVEAPGQEVQRATTQEAEGPKVSVAGRVLEDKGRRPIAHASVYVRGQPVEASTDKDGRFSVELPVEAFPWVYFEDNAVLRRGGPGSTVVELISYTQLPHACECIMKICGMGFQQYIAVGFNKLDFFIVCTSKLYHLAQRTCAWEFIQHF